MEAGRALDALVAEKVMGWKLVWRGIDGAPNRWKDQKGIIDKEDSIPPYSTDIAAAWEVVEKLRTIPATGDWASDSPQDLMIYSYDGQWIVGWRAIPSECVLDPCAESESLPHGICLAALEAVDRLDKKGTQ